MDEQNNRQKIAILGGGVGAMTTAFELTNAEDWQSRYEITIYQMGWRLGGKGASGRNADVAQRIEEHGLHVWFGFYENAFRMIRMAYDECRNKGLAPESPFQDWRAAFSPQYVATTMENTASGWIPWTSFWPGNSSVPGDEQLFAEHRPVPAPWDFVLMILKFLVDEIDALHKLLNLEESTPAAGVAIWATGVLRSFNLQVEKAGMNVLQLALAFAQKLHHDPTRNDHKHFDVLLHLLDNFFERFRTLVKEQFEHDKRIRRALYGIDIACATVRGLIVDDVIRRGYEVIDDYEIAAWLVRHGSLLSSDSPILRGLYDACFAYRDGDPKQANLAAGACIQGFLRMFLTYRGAVAWRMNSGMGDTIFSPLYLVLKNRGVKFEFFNRVKSLGLSSDRKTIQTVEIDVQATVREGEYDPLVYVKGLPCWPSVPRYDQLIEGEAMKDHDIESAWTDWKPTAKRVLECGKDFDSVVLGISIGALPHICGELIEQSEEWKNMVLNVKTVATQAVQLWLHKTAEEMGWQEDMRMPAEGGKAFVSSYVEPHDTYADMTHILPTEDWREADNVQQIAYFCNCLEDAGGAPPLGPNVEYARRELGRAYVNGLEFLKTHIRPLWPQALDTAGALDWSVLVDREEGRAGPLRFDAQFWRANVDPSERYVLSVKGSSKYRLAPGDSKFVNLILAGDWTRNILNCGCVEAGVISGMMASQAICGSPDFIYGAFAAVTTQGLGASGH